MSQENLEEGASHSTPVTHILYLEDDQGLARLLRTRLGRYGIRVDLAGDGEEGLAQLERTRYHLVLIDYDMPGLDGLEVMRRLFLRPQAPPAIMLTGHGNEKIAVQAMKLGASDYLVKDVDLGYLELLPLMIDQVLKRQQLLEQRNQMLVEARESEERYRKLVELSPDGISVHSDGRFEFVNPAGAAILGVRLARELVGRPVLDFVHPHYHQVFQERLRLIEEQDLELPWLEEKFLRSDGAVVDVEVTALPLITDGRRAFQTIFRDITERKAAELRLERMANYDVLTSLPNRSFFFDRLNQLILLAKRDGFRFALLFIDLDRFKQANDSLGHYYGDLLLKEVAQRLKACLRESDTVARMGGDEFVVILSCISAPHDAALMAERITGILAKPFLIQERECLLGASIGISLFPEDGDTKEQQLVKADTAMYRSKRLGRNTWQFFTPPPAGPVPGTRPLTRSQAAEPGPDADPQTAGTAADTSVA
jgi:diguanylate cyclase (GGDEF)-like protein/PAS domain S-box-containing protein